MSDETEAAALAELRSAIGSALLISVGGETKMPREDWLRIESAGLRLWGEMPVVGVIPQEDSAQSVKEAAATVELCLQTGGHTVNGFSAFDALSLLVERAERAALLEAERDKWRDDCIAQGKVSFDLLQRAEAAEARAARLRDALERIAEERHTWSAADFEEAMEIARAALAAGSEGEP